MSIVHEFVIGAGETKYFSYAGGTPSEITAEEYQSFGGTTERILAYNDLGQTAFIGDARVKPTQTAAKYSGRNLVNLGGNASGSINSGSIVFIVGIGAGTDDPGSGGGGGGGTFPGPGDPVPPPDAPDPVGDPPPLPTGNGNNGFQGTGGPLVETGITGGNTT